MIKAKRNGNELFFLSYLVKLWDSQDPHNKKNILKEPISILSFFHKISAPLLHQYYKKYLKKASFLKL